jgi:hypothetical protein
MLRDGFLRFCDDPELACCRAEAELGQLRAENTQLRIKLAVQEQMEEALKKIANPIFYMRKEAEAAGCMLDGAMAIRLCEDPYYYREVARKTIDSLLGGKEDE